MCPSLQQHTTSLASRPNNSSLHAEPEKDSVMGAQSHGLVNIILSERLSEKPRDHLMITGQQPSLIGAEGFKLTQLEVAQPR